MPDKKKTEKVYAKHTFTTEELKDIASELARKVNEQATAEDEKKSITSSLKARLDELVARINKLSENYNSGFDYRDIECELRLDFDAKLRRYFNVETGETVKEEPLRPEDYQQSMDMEPDKLDIPDDLPVSTGEPEIEPEAVGFPDLPEDSQEELDNA